jgi:hypothetical protein
MTVRFLRIASLLAVAAFAATAHASSAAVAGPTGLHGFLLRADEATSTTFQRTPSFAWNPVPGAVRYQFQLATSSTFRDNGVLYDNAQLLTPVEAPALTLPWITGSPHSLYARARAILASGTSPWSAPYGFDMAPPPPPTPISSYPGVLRWTPVEGATGYQVWLIDVGKFELVRTNVLDEREFYTFHPTLKWAGTVRWRIRAIRGDVFNYRVNGIPVAPTGAWSPVYSSTNPAMSTGPITLTGTLSDVFADGSAKAPAQRQMPAFLWTGNQTTSGTPAELFRVYVFTDKQCLNPVYTSAVVGSPSYAPRPFGPLQTPQSAAAIQGARASYLPDGTESGNVMYDGTTVVPTEQTAAASATTTIPGDVPSAPGTTPPPSSTPSTGGTVAGGGGGAITVAGKLGAPVSLWDTNWPESGYYWTVIPVSATVLGAASTNVVAPGATKGSAVIPVLDSSNFRVGMTIMIGSGPSADTGTITVIGGGTITVAANLANSHVSGDPMVSISSFVVYQDLELPQDVCADIKHPERVQRFGIESEPSLTTAQAPFATGLSSTGRLVSAVNTSQFYGQPLVAWTPALGAQIYQLQWSKKKYPFVAQDDPATKAKGLLTFSTSAVLPLGPGTWWYRVRGFDFNLPSGAQQMGWSDPEQLVISRPKFKIASSGAKPKFKLVP